MCSLLQEVPQDNNAHWTATISLSILFTFRQCFN